jgi:hypothetical protein
MKILRHVGIQVRIIDVLLCTGQQCHFTEGPHHDHCFMAYIYRGRVTPWLENGDKIVNFNPLDIK